MWRSALVILLLVTVAWVMEADAGEAKKGLVPLPPAYPEHVRPSKPQKAIKPKAKKERKK